MRILVDTLPRWSGGILAHLRGVFGADHLPDDVEVFLIGTSRLRDAIGTIDSHVVFVTLDEIPESPIRMRLWREHRLPDIFRRMQPDIHFGVQGNLVPSSMHALRSVIMSRNLQPHLSVERRRLPILSRERLRLELLKMLYRKTYRKADGIIFLSQFAREISLSEGLGNAEAVVIPNGLSDAIRKAPVRGHLTSPVRLLYVSDFNEYKFQWEVARAVDMLRRRTNIEIHLHLVGGKSRIGWRIFERALTELRHPDWITVTERVSPDKMNDVYHNADLFIFASSVETFGNALIEAMAAGLPIACSDKRPMSDILGSGGAYFNPENAASIADAVEPLLLNDDVRFANATSAYERALSYTWKRTADQTFAFLRKIAVK